MIKINRLNKNKKRKSIIAIMLFFLLFVVSAKPAAAAGEVIGAIGSIVSTILSYVNYALGYILTFIFSILIQVAQYNDFIISAPVNTGWVIVRDLCNMFFILILLIIAFATILRLESYSWKKNLPKLLIMAVLINFSKTIAGLIIDFSQVIMLTFVSAFSQNGANNFVSLFQVDKYLAINPECKTGSDSNALGYAVLLGSVSGTIALIITLVVTVVLLAVLVMRIVMLWIYIILSPLAYLLSAFPQGQKYAGQWWSEFSKNVITGPILAFFLWLALTTASTTKLGTDATVNNAKDNSTAVNVVCGGTSLFTSGPFQEYIVTIGLLIGGLIVTQQAGGAAGGFAAKGLGWAKKSAALTLAGVGLAAGYANRKQATKTGFDLSPTRQYQRIKASLGRSKQEDLRKSQLKATANLEKGGLRGALTGFTATDWTENYVKGFLGYKGIKKAFVGGQKKVETLRGQEAEAKWLGANVTDTAGYYDKLQKVGTKHTQAVAAGNATEAEAYDKELKNLKANKERLVYDSEDARREKTKEYQGQQQRIGKLASELTVTKYEGKAEERAAIAEQSKKVTSDNEDELSNDFQNAMSSNNASLAGAIALKLSSIGGMNALMAKYGYGGAPGFTERESNKLIKDGKHDEVLKKRGLNDFMRDVFRDKLKMNEQNMLALQSDMSSRAEATSHDYMKKTVSVDAAGKFYQPDGSVRERLLANENKKKENETGVRRDGRYAYVEEDAQGKASWTTSGLMNFIDRWALITKEMDANRFNKNAAKVIADPELIGKLKPVLLSAFSAGLLPINKYLKEEVNDTDGTKGKEQVEAFIERFNKYAQGSGKDSAGNDSYDSLRKIIHDEKAI